MKSAGRFLLALFLVVTQLASAHTLTFPGQAQLVRDRPYHVSIDQCGEAIAAEVDAAAAVWNHYAPARLRRIRGDAPPRAQRFAAVTCQDDIYFREILRQPAGLDGTAYWRYSNWQLTSADIVFNTSNYVPGHCSRLHEFGHALGLWHSTVANAVMSENSNCRYPTADDLVGIAEAFGVAPTCTPFVTDDFTVYFPSIAGEWLELQPIVRGDIAAGFRETGKGPAIGAGWQCNLVRTADAIEGSFFHKGRIFRVTLRRSAGGWELAAVAPEPQT